MLRALPPSPLFRSRTVQDLKRLFGYLPLVRIRSLTVLVPLSLLPGCIDLLSVAVIARLTGALVGSDLEDRLPSIHVFGGTPVDQSFWLVLIFIVLAWAASISKITLKFFQQRLSADIWHDLATQVYSRLLNQPYEFHLGKSTADLGSQFFANINRVATNVVTPTLQIISASVSILLLSIGILFVGRWMAMILVAGLVVAYWVFSALVTPRLRKGYQHRSKQEVKSAEILFESLGSIRDIQLTGSEDHFERQFGDAGNIVKYYNWLTEWLPDLPRALIEPFGITMIFLVGAIPALLSGDPSRIKLILPFLATIAVASLRLTPPLQDAFRSLTQLRGGLPLLSSVLDLLDLPADRPTLHTPGVVSPSGINPRHSVRLSDAWYRYPNSEDWVLRGVSIVIPVGSRIALVGATGSGKTTAANLLLGLLAPGKGSLDIDGIRVEGFDLPAWQANCAQVPQLITLLNGSVIENVAFGMSFEDADLNAVWEALESAQLDEFVSELPYGLHTQIGENGVRLSGGQRQRLALARAFYRKASFLILDEATSALDNRTESEVIEALDVVARRCTTVVIAHRLSTIQRCDRIYEFVSGQVNAYGSFAELQRLSSSFRDLAELEPPSMS